MMSKFVELTRKSKILGAFIRAVFWIVFQSVSAWNEITGWLRTIGIGGKQYVGMKSVKGKYEGKRCFILCTGPSLTIQDMELLKNEYTFGMNSIIKVYEKTAFRPTYYGIQDHIVYDSIKNDIMKYYGDKENVFVSDRIKWHFQVGTKWRVFPLNMSYNGYARWFKEKFWAKFSDDAYRRVYSGFSITISLIEIAVYMGFKEIYLIGADCSFSNPNKLHFAEHGVVDKTINTAKERNIAGYMAVKESADKADFKVYNSTRGGELEVFERRNLEDVLAGLYCNED